MPKEISLPLIGPLKVDVEVIRDQKGDRVFFRVDNRAVATIRVSTDKAFVDWAIPLFLRIVGEDKLLKVAMEHWKGALC